MKRYDCLNTKCFRVHDGTVTVCRWQRYQVARGRLFGGQKLQFWIDLK